MNRHLKRRHHLLPTLILCCAIVVFLHPVAGGARDISSRPELTGAPNGSDGYRHQLTLTTEAILRDTAGESLLFPKYTTQLINLANQNAQATRPKVIGQMSELIQQFEGDSYEQWVQWYTASHPDAVDTATRKILDMIRNLRSAMDQIDEAMVRKWVNDLVLAKTYAGLRFQKAILNAIAGLKHQPCRLANPSEESRGIDGYIGELPVSIKPISYESKAMLNESIEVNIIFYEKRKNALTVYYDF